MTESVSVSTPSNTVVNLDSSAPPATTEEIATSVQKVTPDDLLDMYAKEDAEKAGKEAPKSASKQPPKLSDLKKAPEVKTETKIASSNEGEEIEVEGDGEEHGSEEESSKEGEKEGSQEVKSLKAKFGDEELDIPEEALIPHTLSNGKQIDIKVKDALKAFTYKEEFNRAADRRVNDIVQRESSYKKEVEGVRGWLKTVEEAASTGDFMTSLKMIAEMTGQDPVEYEKKAIGDMERIADEIRKLTPEQRETLFLKRKLQLKDKQIQDIRSAEEYQMQRSTIQQQVEAVKQKHNLDDETFKSLFNELVEAQIFQDPNQITPAHIEEYYNEIGVVRKVNDAIGSVSPEMLNDDGFIQKVFNVCRPHPELTQADIADIIRDTIGKSVPVQNLNRKVEKSGVKPSTQYGRVSSKGKEEPQSWDDL